MTLPKLPQTYYHDKHRTNLFGLLTGIATVLGLVMLSNDNLLGAFVLAFAFALLLYIGTRFMPSKTFLKVDERGFETSTIFGKTRVDWDAVAEFGRYSAGRSNGVGYNMRKDTPVGATGRLRYGKKFEKTLPDTYNMNTADLAAMMNGLMETYGR